MQSLAFLRANITKYRRQQLLWVIADQIYPVKTSRMLLLTR